MESGGPSAILGPLERLGQGRTRDGKGRSTKGHKDQGSFHNRVTEEQDKEVQTEAQVSQRNIDIRV